MLDESWYVTPPACFTRAGPVHVETSSLEDLLIEHPSMSVYRATVPPIVPDSPPVIIDTSEETGESVIIVPVRKAPCIYSKKNLRQNKNLEVSRRSRMSDYKATQNEKNIEIVQLYSAQKVRS